MIAVIGAGPAGLIAAETLASAGHTVTLYDRMPTPGRRFLMAGVGGLNLTHSEPVERFLGRYREAQGMLAEPLASFSPQDLRAWADGLGAETFVGSSGRIFPKAMKASPLLRAWLARLEAQGVRFAMRHDWQGFEGNALLFTTPDGCARIAPDATILAMGGASWPRLGADGSWTKPLEDVAIDIAPLRPSNAGFLIDWSDHMARHSGAPLKTIALTCAGETVLGEAVLTRTGLEGGAVYALSAPVREACGRDGSAMVYLDLKPGLSVEELSARLAKARKGDSLSNTLRKHARLDSAASGVLREGGTLLADTNALAQRIKAVPLTVQGLAGLERAISSAGGIRAHALTSGLMLKNRPGTFAAGEMLDWEAPTGGYLLQASFATGIAAAHGLMDWLRS